MTGRALGAAMGLSHVAIHHWETAGAAPATTHISMLARALGCTTDYLLTGREAPRHAALVAAVRAAGTRDPRLLALLERG
jgi:transcriptional regulator with XRE-family HTH domain